MNEIIRRFDEVLNQKANKIAVERIVEDLNQVVTKQTSEEREKTVN